MMTPVRTQAHHLEMQLAPTHIGRRVEATWTHPQTLDCCHDGRLLFNAEPAAQQCHALGQRQGLRRRCIPWSVTGCNVLQVRTKRVDGFYVLTTEEQRHPGCREGICDK